MTPRSTPPAADAGLAELEYRILVTLADGPSHGYAIGKELEAKSGGRMNPTTGTLYQALKRLTAAGWIEPSAGVAAGGGDARRKVFALTRAGARAVAEEARRLESLVQAARRKKLYPAPR